MPSLPVSPARLLAIAVACLASAASAQAAEGPLGEEFFEKQVRPLLAKRCYECHSEASGKHKGGLQVDSAASLLKGGGSGPAVDPTAPTNSLLLKAVRYTDADLQMPPDARLPAEEVAVLEAWAKAGAPLPRADVAATAASSSGALWSLAPLAQPPVPQVKDTRWAHTDVDRFVLAGLQSKGLRPLRDADKRTLLRRATFDLTGLPPTPAQIAAFLADTSPHAFETVIDRLLASRQYGERWGRHWLDVVRYADTSGCNADFPVGEAYKYRNWVIDAFNRDMPFDEMVREQIAGDLMADRTQEKDAIRKVTATGYIAISRRFGSRADEHHLTIDDTLDNLGKAFLGLSIGCARCHDHKFDPVSQRDYYALYGIFASTTYAFPGTEIYQFTKDFDLFGPERERNMVTRQQNERWALAVKLQDGGQVLKTLRPPGEGKRGRGQTAAPPDPKSKEADPAQNTAAELKRQLNELRGQLASIEFFDDTLDRIYSVAEGKPTDARVHRKGDPKNLGDQVPRAFLSALGGDRIEGPGSGRLQLAQWLTDPKKTPLLARVFVNRVWQHHFGTGLVSTPNDFGARGSKPSNPALLDHLASRFVAEGWSIKRLHRELMLSHAYQVASDDDSARASADPTNTTHWRFDRRRLSAEEIRDAMLAISGALDPSVGGAHPFPPERDRHYTQHEPFLATYPSLKRSVYLMQQRIQKVPFFEVFDGADAAVSTGQRPLSTTALQALTMMNDPLVHDLSERAGARVSVAHRSDPERLQTLFERTFGRRARASEIAEGEAYLRRSEAALRRAGVDADDLPRRALASYVRMLFASNEFLYVD